MLSKCPIALALSVFLFGCAAVAPPAGTTPTTPHVATDVFVTRDGVSLPMRQWDASGKPRAIILALHGMSDYSHAFDGQGRQWAASGITTLAFDQRGFGLSPNPGSWAGSDVMRRDFFDFAAAARARYPGVPLFALGESMGGAVLLTALASGEMPPLDGVILVAPAVWSRGDMPLSYRVVLFVAAHLVPGFIISNSSASHFVTVIASDNIEMLRALGRDPLFQKQTRVEALFGLVNLMDEARAAPRTMPANPPPILLLTGKKDQIVPGPATAGLIADLGPRADVRHYDNGYHMLLRDLEGPKVSQDVADWVLSKVPAAQPK